MIELRPSPATALSRNVFRRWQFPQRTTHFAISSTRTSQATAKANVGSEERSEIAAFIAAFASHFERSELGALMPLAIELRRSDRNVTEGERAELAAFELGARAGE